MFSQSGVSPRLLFGEVALPPPTPATTVLGLNDGGDKVGPSRAEVLCGAVVMEELGQL